MYLAPPGLILPHCVSVEVIDPGQFETLVVLWHISASALSRDWFQVIFLRFLVTGVLMLLLTRVPDTQLIKVGYRLLAALCLAITSQVHRQSTLCSAAGAVFLIYKHACVTVIEWSARRFTSTE